MAGNIIDRYYHYQNRATNRLVKNSVRNHDKESKRLGSSAFHNSKHDQLIKDIELKLIPSLKVISLVSNKLHKQAEDYNVEKQKYTTSLIKYNNEVKKELEKQRIIQEKKDKEEALKKQREEEKEKELIAIKEKERLEKLKESARFMYSPIRVTEEFQANQKRIIEIEETIRKPVESSPQAKQIYAQRRLVNPTFGQLTNSRRQLVELTAKVIHYITQAKPDPLAYKWLLNFTAKALCKQAELECRVKPEMAIPLAEMTHLLNQSFPELINDYLMPRLIKKCPVILGYMSNDKKEMGFKVKDLQHPEMKSVYLERMDGLLAFYSMLCKSQNNNGVSLDLIWKMVTRWGNRNIKSLDGDLVFGSLVTVLECCGNEFDQRYGKQAHKLINTFLVGDFQKEFSPLVNWKRLMIMVEDKMAGGRYKSFPPLLND